MLVVHVVLPRALLYALIGFLQQNSGVTISTSWLCWTCGAVGAQGIIGINPGGTLLSVFLFYLTLRPLCMHVEVGSASILKPCLCIAGGHKGKGATVLMQLFVTLQE